MRLWLLSGVGVALAACGPPAAERAPGPDASSPPAAQAPDRPETLGGGQPMSGSVSPLSGLVTAFQVEETDSQIIVELAADVLFAFDSAELSPQAPEQLLKTVAQIQRGAAGDIRVIGHTDAQGDDAYNDDLSIRRARAVADWLSQHGGTPAARLKAEGRGEREPVAPNEGVGGRDNPEGRAKNRRVQVIIPKA